MQKYNTEYSVSVLLFIRQNIIENKRKRRFQAFQKCPSMCWLITPFGR